MISQTVSDFNTWKRFRQRLDTSIIFNKINVTGLTKSSFSGCSRIEKRYEETCNILGCRRLYSCFHTIMQGSDDDVSHTGSCVVWTFSIVLVSELITVRLEDMIGSHSQVKEWKNAFRFGHVWHFILPNIRRIRDGAKWGNKGAQTFGLDLSMGPKRIGVSPTLSPDEGRQSFPGNTAPVIRV